MGKNIIRAGFFQFRPVFGKISKNTETIITALKNVKADIIVLPELPFTGYFFKDREEVKQLAENPKKSATVESLINLCKARKFYLVTGFAEKAKDKYFNSALLLGPQGILHIYRKLHLFNEEKYWFDAGDKSLKVNTVRGAKIGMMVCFDWIFPEVTRVLALLGAQLICHPSNLVLSYCQQTMLSRCLENGVYAITANRFGSDNRPHGELRFTGKSQIAGPKGEIIFRAKSQQQNLTICDIDLEKANDKMITKTNHIIKDRRSDFYKTLVIKRK